MALGELHGRSLSSALMRGRVHNRTSDRGGKPIRLAWPWALPPVHPEDRGLRVPFALARCFTGGARWAINPSFRLPLGTTRTADSSSPPLFTPIFLFLTLRPAKVIRIAAAW